ncbi:hypothetical protein BHE74_00052028 [Ensete ventricosum]|nr:hypothetical protein BHE74_00052028 [Ensete ventricosum]
MSGSMELQPDNGSRSSIGIRPGSDDVVGSRREFPRRFAKGIGKLTGNMKGDHREKTRGLTAGIPEAIGLAKVGNPGGGQQLSVGKLPRCRLNRPYHRIRATASG